MNINTIIKCEHICGEPKTKFNKDNCPLCNGKGYYYGIDIDLNGRIKKIYNIEIIRQRIIKMFLTPKRSNSGYGLNYNLLKNIDQAIFEINRAIDYLMNISKIKYKIINLDVKNIEPRKMNIFLDIQIENKILNINTSLRI